MRHPQFCLATLGLISAQTFHFQGNPYKDSSNVADTAFHQHLLTQRMETHFQRVFDNFTSADQYTATGYPPMVGQYIYPEKSGKYPFFLWIGGLYSEIQAQAYSDILGRFAKKGFVIGVNTHAPDFRKRQNYTLWDEMLTWHFENAQKFLDHNRNQDEGGYEIEIDFDNIVVGCHSSGCELQKYFMNTKDQLFKGYWFLDPVLMPAGEGLEILNHAVTTDNFVAIESTELCETCCFNHVANQPLMESINTSTLKLFQFEKHAGHCTSLNQAYALLCGKVMCNAEARYQTKNYLNKVHGCDVGHTTAFFADAMFNDASMRDYYQHVDNYCRDFMDSSQQTCSGSHCL